jgi:hypothetical protein
MRQPTCVTGRVPPEDATDSGPKFFASLYSVGKGGVKGLDCGPKQGQTRKEALNKLLLQVETDIGRMMIVDRRERREREEAREREGRRNGGNSI